MTTIEENKEAGVKRFVDLVALAAAV